MPYRPDRAPFVLVSAILLLCGGEGGALAGNTAERCVAEAERAQVLREEGRLVESRAEFAACGSEGCPVVVRRECLRWLTDVDERSPSLIVSVKNIAGADVLGAAVLLDGAPLPATSLGRAFAVNPGAHVVRAEHPDYSPIEQQVVVREREKGRLLALVLSAGETEAPKPRTIPWLSWALGGVAVLGGAGFGGFWASGMDKVSDLRGSCAPYCSPEQIDSVRPTFTAARVSLGLGIGAAVGAVLVHLLQPSSASSRTSNRSAVGPLAPLASAAFAAFAASAGTDVAASQQ